MNKRHTKKRNDLDALRAGALLSGLLREIGAKGGKSKSTAKSEAARKNAEKARKAMAKKRAQGKPK